MGVSYDALINLIQEKIRNDYDSPNAAGCAVRRNMELRGEKPISEDTVARVYYRPEDSTYLPKRESLEIIAQELGIPVKDEEKLQEYIRNKNEREVIYYLKQLKDLDSVRLLAEFAALLGLMEQKNSHEDSNSGKTGRKDLPRYTEKENRYHGLSAAADKDGGYHPTQ